MARVVDRTDQPDSLGGVGPHCAARVRRAARGIAGPGRELRDGVNTLAFEMPKFPHERDPYIYIYNLEADLAFGKDKLGPFGREEVAGNEPYFAGARH